MKQENPEAFEYRDDSDDNSLQNGGRKYPPLEHSPTRKPYLATQTVGHSSNDSTSSSQIPAAKGRVSRIQPPTAFKLKLNAQKSQGKLEFYCKHGQYLMKKDCLILGLLIKKLFSYMVIKYL